MGKKNKIVKNTIYIILILIIILSWINYRFLEDGRENQIYDHKYFQICKEYSKIDKNDIQKFEQKYIKEFDKDFKVDDNFVDYCNKITKYKTSTYSAFYLFENIMFDRFMSILFPFFVPLLILFPIIYELSKRFNSKEVKNYLLRDNYKNYIKNIFKTAYKDIWILPTILIVIFGICCLVTRNLNPEADINLMLIDSTMKTLYNNPIFYISYIIIIVLNLGIYINIALTILSKNKNFIVSLIESFLIIYILWFVSEVIIGLFFQNNLNILTNYFNLLTIYSWRNTENILLYLTTNLSWYLLTLLIALLSYKNKEKFIHMCEK